jgi:hypothetical protein
MNNEAKTCAIEKNGIVKTGRLVVWDKSNWIFFPFQTEAEIERRKIPSPIMFNEQLKSADGWEVSF